jgi:hypothetical protein
MAKSWSVIRALGQVLLADGSIRVWGKWREITLPPSLGIPSSQSPLISTSPPLITALSVGCMHTLAVTSDDRVHAWGPDFGTNCTQVSMPDPISVPALFCVESLLSCH